MGLPLRRFYVPGGVRDPSRAVVGVPGLAASGRSFARLRPLADRYDLRFVTTPLAEPLPGSPAEALADLVVEYVSSLDRPVLLGTSFGSLVALTAALAAPERLAGLVLVSALSAGSMVPAIYAAFSGALLAPRPVAWLAAPAAARVLGGAGLDGEARRELVREGRLLSGREQFRRVAAILGTDLTRLLPRLRVPVLLIHGTRDRVIPVAAARRLAAAAPGWRYHEIEGAGHVPYLSHPGRFLAVLEPFLAEVLPAPLARAPETETGSHAP
jgi:pimeloyl-[acyl-carrier protein] methyl ester esterase